MNFRDATWTVFCLVMIVPNIYSIVVVSILDRKSAMATLIKIFSILKSANDEKVIEFKFLLIPDGKLDEKLWNSEFRTCFPNSIFETKTWRKPDSLPYLSNSGFEIDAIFARFYIPKYFSNIKRYIYLDNDVIVTTDLHYLFSHRMLVSRDIPSYDPFPKQANIRVGKTVEKIGPSNAHKSTGRPGNGALATIGLVYERHPGYKEYLQRHFNCTHPIVQAALQTVGNDAFLNGGVVVVDSVRWNSLQYTEKVEKLMIRNQNEYIYDSTGLGDQGPLFLLFQNDTDFLQPQFNMRRLPKKTVSMLDAGYTGIVHFAGTTQANAGVFCVDPLRYPLLLTAVVPLYLSIVHSFRKENRSTSFAPEIASCEDAVNIVQRELDRLSLKARYNPGKGKFYWPPI